MRRAAELEKEVPVRVERRAAERERVGPPRPVVLPGPLEVLQLLERLAELLLRGQVRLENLVCVGHACGRASEGGHLGWRVRDAVGDLDFDGALAAGRHGDGGLPGCCRLGAV